MLSHTDVHLLVGMLSRITNPDDVDIILGERVYDEGSETKRDVDITITSKQPDGSIAAYAGIEVKDEGPALGTQEVEQLAAKLNDMPSITSRTIVSASGYTRPAKKKAAKHGIKLLTLRAWQRGEMVFGHMSRQFDASARATKFRWDSMAVGWASDPEIDEQTAPPPTTLVMDLDGKGDTLGNVADRISKQVLDELIRSESLAGMVDGDVKQFSVDRILPRPIKLDFNGQRLRLIGIRIAGGVRATRHEMPHTMKVLVEEDTGKPHGDPHAWCMVGVLPNGDLMGVGFGARDQNLHTFKVPLSARNLNAITRLGLPRPHRVRVP